MAKSRKKKIGLQKKVSSVFEGVSIPQADDTVQTSPASTAEDPCDASSKSTPNDSLVSKSSLMKKVRRSKRSSDKAVKRTTKKVAVKKATKKVVAKRTASKVSTSKDSPTRKTRRAKGKTDITVEKTTKKVVSKRTASKVSASKDSPTRKTRQTKDKTDKTVKKTRTRTVSKRTASAPSASKDSTTQKTRHAKGKTGKAVEKTTKLVLPKPTDLDPPTLQEATTQKPGRAKNKPDKAIEEIVKTVFSEQTALDPLVPRDSTAPKPHQPENEPDKATPSRTVGPLPKLKDLDHLIPHLFSAQKPSRAKLSLDKASSERPIRVPPKLTTPDDPILERALAEEPLQAADTPDKGESDRTIEVPSTETISDREIVQASRGDESPQEKDSSNDDHTTASPLGIPSWMMNLSDTDSQDALTTETTPSEEIPSPSESALMDDIIQTTDEESTPQRSSADDSREAEKTSEQVAPINTSRVRPKLTTPDRPISRRSSTETPEQIEIIRDETKAQPTHSGDALESSTAEIQATQKSLFKKLHQTESTPELSDPDRPDDTASISKSEDHQEAKKSESERRYGPEAPGQESAPPAPPETIDLTEASGPSLRQRISTKLFASKPGVSSNRQKAMVVLIPVLVIILIFAFRQVLNKSPKKTKGTPVTDTSEVIVKADPVQEIEWQIPEPLPATMRDPTVLAAPTHPVENEQPQSQTANQKKSELINLGSIVYSEDRSSAIVNGRIVHAGDEVSGMTVLKVNKDSVEFEKDGERWVERKHK